MQDLSGWTPRPAPQHKVLEGRFVRLEPLDAQRHGAELFAASSVADAQQRFTWLFEEAPATLAAMQPWLEKASTSKDPLFFAVIDKASGKVGGRQALMRIDTTYGSAEIGNIYWGPLLARQPAATEAQYLFMRMIFEELGYRRYEWKCNNNNLPSKRAAERFGFTFEGVFRQHMITKGKNRDTAWFSIIDSEWPALKQAYQNWLAADNFDDQGVQRRTLQSFYR